MRTSKPLPHPLSSTSISDIQISSTPLQQFQPSSKISQSKGQKGPKLENMSKEPKREREHRKLNLNYHSEHKYTRNLDRNFGQRQINTQNLKNETSLTKFSKPDKSEEGKLSSSRIEKQNSFRKIEKVGKVTTVNKPKKSLKVMKNKKPKKFENPSQEINNDAGRTLDAFSGYQSSFIKSKQED